MLITQVFSVDAKKSRTFYPVSHIQLMSRCAGVGRDYRNRDSQDDQWNITYYKCHAQFM